MPGETEFVEQTLHMVFHFLKSRVGVLRFLDPDDLDLIELVQSVETAHVLAVAAGLATPAG